MSEVKPKAAPAASPRPLHLHVAIPDGYELRIDGDRVRIGPIEQIAESRTVGDTLDALSAAVERRDTELSARLDRERGLLLPCGCRGRCPGRAGHEAIARGGFE